MNAGSLVTASPLPNLTVTTRVVVLFGRRVAVVQHAEVRQFYRLRRVYLCLRVLSIATVFDRPLAQDGKAAARSFWQQRGIRPRGGLQCTGKKCSPLHFIYNPYLYILVQPERIAQQLLTAASYVAVFFGKAGKTNTFTVYQTFTITPTRKL